jgi:hypothetical protein
LGAAYVYNSLYIGFGCGCPVCHKETGWHGLKEDMLNAWYKEVELGLIICFEEQGWWKTGRRWDGAV